MWSLGAHVQAKVVRMQRRPIGLMRLTSIRYNGTHAWRIVALDITETFTEEKLASIQKRGRHEKRSDIHG